MVGIYAKELYLIEAQNCMDKAVYVSEIADLTEQRAALECEIKQLTEDK